MVAAFGARQPDAGSVAAGRVGTVPARTVGRDVLADPGQGAVRRDLVGAATGAEVVDEAVEVGRA